MESSLFQWLFDMLVEFGKFGSWLVNPLPYINVSPLALFGFGGITILIGFLLVRLVVGG